MLISKEQEEYLNKMREKNEKETLYKCVDCKVKLKGLISVREHCYANKHYSYKQQGVKGILWFV